MWKNATLVFAALFVVATVLLVHALQVAHDWKAKYEEGVIAHEAYAESHRQMEWEGTMALANCVGELDRVNSYLVSSSITQDFQHFQQNFGTTQRKSPFLPMPGVDIKHFQPGKIE